MRREVGPIAPRSVFPSFFSYALQSLLDGVLIGTDLAEPPKLLEIPSGLDLDQGKRLIRAGGTHDGFISHQAAAV